MKIEYSSNNSGGEWWLKDKDWIALEAAGWSVPWGGLAYCGYEGDAKFCPKPRCAKGKCGGHPKFKSHTEMTKADRWLGALAREASKEFKSVDEAKADFERITGQDTEAEGCRCCGEPHYFSVVR
jgi:hypothetical protein